MPSSFLRHGELWSLREDVSVEQWGAPGDGSVRLRGRWGDVVVRRPSPEMGEALRRMCLGPVTLANVLGPAGRSGGGDEYRQLSCDLERLDPMIVRSLGGASGQPLLSVVPLAKRSRFRIVPLAPEVPVRLSVYAAMRTNGREISMESPLALHRVVLHRPEAMRFIAPLARPLTPGAFVTALAPTAPVAVAAAVLEYLVAAGMLVVAEPAAGRTPAFREDTDPAVAGWSPVDMMFHARSTLGRHDHDFGRTYPGWAAAGGRAGTPAAGEPAVRRPAAAYIPLYRPRWEDLRQTDLSLTAAMEGRRSSRRYGAAPVTAGHVGELLYRTARVRSLVAATELGEFSDRPYPSCGASFELELYLTVGNCAGLGPGVYHYDPVGHRLEPVDGDQAAAGELLTSARIAAAMEAPPPVLLGMTARFGRLSRVYEGMAYRLVLIHVGVLMQSLYLVSTAMGLAPCALGVVSVDAAARAFGADWRLEPCVGQFMVGGEPGDATNRHPAGHRDVNDAQWADFARTFRHGDRTSR
jgi:SagB-type dehydrogenase family enzyme